MRIDIRGSESDFSGYQPARAGQNQDSPAFQALLEQALGSAVLATPQPSPSSAVPVMLSMNPVNLTEDELDAQEDLEIQEEESELLEIREESYEEDLLENEEVMEDLVEQWEEAAPGEEDKVSERELDDLSDQMDLQDLGLDLADDLPELGLEPESAILDGDSDSSNSRDSSEEKQGKASGKSGQAYSAESAAVQEREMTYTEIQHLVDTVLHGSSTLPYKLHRVLGKVLDSLISGQRYPLDQHTLLDLDVSEWKTLFELFPPRFFHGLIRPLQLNAGNDFQQIKAGYALFDKVFYQRGLEPQDLDLLEELWGALVPLPSMFTSWLRQPELPTLSLTDLQYPLEMLQQHQGLLPGASGRIQGLALQYLHHPETAVELLSISRQILHGLPLNEAQNQLLSEKLADYCFSNALQSSTQIVPILSKALAGQDLSQEEILQILQGASQKILSHLPYAQLPASLQEIIDFIHTDPDHSEDNILALFLENESQS
ncbi:hypothetical protein COW36_06175 [bacterium (Candidatus Blackallbacteria) CG17_big_fil_post_rev_8_21_14_2_50_48_46]|uniref:Uncharacterized protein n=1 Tax=bacterium (Candidatus Blackallbacteria) CG17_big_fil_post_rev_8_21_14_2_50_48_46 TaxID=2014261 RepID=A0A2M7G7Y5_9BACT|nr:MAG: hypothetical protein COW64_17005 [bacterium (Candidatus Blackallbacteria) CG18_big_fil_WC_8_21_14_2_50_49_26]PIW18113.1 MAG: hypothetical protein COW36_06175 [bacterium (Candidatus Blackallbacteria) CG17_big_fil_post_rev_8_21_14_2_50_48_46]PIW51122.1 MAG: hypothetical protein COW20_00325 [bacterium (Candidatus Blackallbacteria) CG13_big_fil_rev_8_21_14_2_50_49_14]